MPIKTQAELRAEIAKAVAGDQTSESDIATYKMYNFYMYNHVKEGSPEDLENEVIFNALEKEQPELHSRIETLIDRKLRLQEAMDELD